MIFIIFLWSTVSFVAAAAQGVDYFFLWNHPNCTGSFSVTPLYTSCNSDDGQTSNYLLCGESYSTLNCECQDAACTVGCSCSPVYVDSCGVYDADAGTSYQYTCISSPQSLNNPSTPVAPTETNNGGFATTTTSTTGTSKIDSATMLEIKALVAGAALSQLVLDINVGVPGKAILAAANVAETLIDNAAIFSANVVGNTILTGRSIANQINSALTLDFLNDPYAGGNKRASNQTFPDVSFIVAAQDSSLLVGITYGELLLGYLNASVPGLTNGTSVTLNYTYSYTTNSSSDVTTTTAAATASSSGVASTSSSTSGPSGATSTSSTSSTSAPQTDTSNTGQPAASTSGSTILRSSLIFVLLVIVSFVM